jgi:hypothetical protein
MRIVITAHGLYFAGRAGDFRRFLERLGVARRLLADYLREQLR